MKQHGQFHNWIRLLQALLYFTASRLRGCLNWLTSTPAVSEIMENWLNDWYEFYRRKDLERITGYMNWCLHRTDHIYTCLSIIYNFNVVPAAICNINFLWQLQEKLTRAVAHGQRRDTPRQFCKGKSLIGYAVTMFPFKWSGNDCCS